MKTYTVVEKRNTYEISATYRTEANSRVEFPEGKSWADVKGWFIKWDTIYVTWRDETQFESELNSDSMDGTDWKRPISVSVYPQDEEGEPNYEVELT